MAGQLRLLAFQGFQQHGTARFSRVRMASKRPSENHGTEPRFLQVDDLKVGTPGITPRFGASLAEALSACLDDHDHPNSVIMTLDGDLSRLFTLSWQSIDGQTRKCWADPEVRTEHGAYGIAALLVPEVTEFTIVERSRKGTGFDYWLGIKGDTRPLFQGKGRLEVSGIRQGTVRDIEHRMQRKLKQIRVSDPMRISAVVMIVEFSEPRSRIVIK